MTRVTRLRLGVVLTLVASFLLTVALLPSRPLKAEEAVVVSLTSVAHATFAGGCFWCMEPPFDKLAGVISTTSGYAGGAEKSPTYESVSSGRTGHIEVVQVAYDPQKVSFATLVDVYWRNVDPFAVNRQFCDSGPHYRSAIFYTSPAEKQIAEATKSAWEKHFGAPIATEILSLNGSFHAAEDYHQDYYLKNPIRYRYYRNGCGRDKRLEAIWGKVEK